MKELLKEFPVVIEIPVAWGDMDAFQHVNNTVYFRFFESARIAYFEELDLIGLMRETGIGPILAAADCRFKNPPNLPGPGLRGRPGDVHWRRPFHHGLCGGQSPAR